MNCVYIYVYICIYIYIYICHGRVRTPNQVYIRTFQNCQNIAKTRPSTRPQTHPKHVPKRIPKHVRSQTTARIKVIGCIHCRTCFGMCFRCPICVF